MQAHHDDSYNANLSAQQRAVAQQQKQKQKQKQKKTLCYVLVTRAGLILSLYSVEHHHPS